MKNQINEQAFEARIESHLLDPSNHNSSNPTFIQAHPKDFDARYAFDKKLLWQFLHATQQEQIEGFKRLNPSDWQDKIVQRLDKKIKTKGVLHVLKKGIDIDNLHLNLMYPAPADNSSHEIRAKFHTNIWSCMRQVPFATANSSLTIDMVLFLNGLPVVTLELKNAWTGQHACMQGQKQYKSRDPIEPLLSFGRCLVHMTADTEEVYMTTKLAGKSTYFLPFNRGNNSGKGNPQHPSGHRTSYLWEEVLQPLNLTNLIEHFVYLQHGTKSKTLNAKADTLLFPRYHQMHVVQNLLADVRAKGVGQRYLIQHSAGSGKTNSMTWLAYQLRTVYETPTSSTPLFDSVIVVTDRRALDRHMKDNIEQFQSLKGIVAHVDSAKKLKEALEGGKHIIITTIQKFPHIAEGMDSLSDKKFAVIIDEAHSSQSGTSHDKMNQAVGSTDAEDDPCNAQDKILAYMEKRKLQQNTSYFAFTATPKNITLEKFGSAQADGTFKPFHIYSMQQAIQEGFILDVLTNYFTHKSYYEIVQSVADNPLFDTKKAQKKLRTYVEQHAEPIGIKAEIMVDHFIEQIVSRKKLKGKAKGMIITQSIESAIKYHKAVTKLLEQRGANFKALLAFSGKKMVGGIEYTEDMVNGFPASKTEEQFDQDEYRLLIVANKYLTGFDQPKLCAMYVDKKLAGVLCVQALSRLNRSAAKYDKKTEDLAILDFYNQPQDIEAEFNKYYVATSLSGKTDVNVLNDLREALSGVGIYEHAEAKQLSTLYFDGAGGDELDAVLNPVVDRFEQELEQTDKVDFKIKARQFVKIYAQLAAILSFPNMDWEELYWFLKLLVPKLKVNQEQEEFDALLESVQLDSYGIKRDYLCAPKLQADANCELDPQNPNPRGAHDGEKEKEPLDVIVQEFNERWFADWKQTPQEQKRKLNSLVDSCFNSSKINKYKNATDEYQKKLAIDDLIKMVIQEHRARDMELYRHYASTDGFKFSLHETIRRMIDLRLQE